MKNKHHTVDLGGFQEWLSEAEITFASSTRERKRLVCTTNGTMKVIVGDKVVWQGIQAYSAVEAYNSIEDVYVKPK